MHLLRYSVNLYQLLWIFILWSPFIFTLYNKGSILSLYDQLTWWSWSIQCIFYSYMHLKLSVIYKKIRLLINKKYKKYIKIINKNFEMYIFGLVLGISTFVFLEFVYVLYHNPSIVSDESSNYNNKGIPQIGNIIIHYYTISATPLWIIFNFRYLQDKLQNFTLKNSIIFSTIWLFYVFLYLAYWKFNINNIFKNYKINDISNTQNILYIFISSLVVINTNTICLFSIKDEIKTEKKHNKVYITDTLNE